MNVNGKDYHASKQVPLFKELFNDQTNDVFMGESVIWTGDRLHRDVEGVLL